MKKFTGKGVYGAIAMGKISVFQKQDTLIQRTSVKDTEAEKARVEAAKAAAAEQLQAIYEKALKEVGETNAQIFEIHMMMLEDDDYNESIQNIIDTQKVNAEYAVSITADNFAEMFSNGFAGLHRFIELMATEPSIQDAPDAQPLEHVQGRVDVNDVSFAYGEKVEVLHNVTLHIPAGETVALVGPSGGGKTTLCQLLPRFYDVDSGSITVDGHDVRAVTQRSLRRAIGIVQQDVFLFTGDIKSNISLRNENITLDEIKAAAKYVNADSFISKMPGGYDEPVTERGSTLSAGQRQLISFARTLAYKPSILVLDEATANIDTETESLITEAMEKLMTGRTTIMVAHRLSTIQHADKIMVMDKGRIVESGNHQELLAQNGVYRKLYDLQLAAEVTR